MNYDETAKKILSDWDNYCFKLLDGDTPAFDIQEAITAALRRAANDAAWRVWEECEKTVIELVEERGGSCDVNPGDYMQDYGPPARRRHAMSDIVTRLWGNTGDKYPGFQNINTEAAAEITRLREDNTRLREENADLRRKLYGVDWEWRKEARDGFPLA